MDPLRQSDYNFGCVTDFRPPIWGIDAYLRSLYARTQQFTISSRILSLMALTLWQILTEYFWLNGSSKRQYRFFIT